MHASSQTMVPRVAASHRLGIYQECQSLGPDLPNLKPQSGAHDSHACQNMFRTIRCGRRINIVPGTEQHLVDVYYYYLALPFILIMYSAYKLYSHHTFVDSQMN